MTELTDHPEGNRGGDPEVDVALDETAGIETGPAAEDLAHGEVEEVTVDVDEEEAPSGPGAENLFWDDEESPALRQARKDVQLTASADSVRTYLKQIGKVALLTAKEEPSSPSASRPGFMPPMSTATEN